MSRWNDSENKIPSTRRISTEHFFFNKKQVFFPEKGGEKKKKERLRRKNERSIADYEWN